MLLVTSTNGISLDTKLSKANDAKGGCPIR